MNKKLFFILLTLIIMIIIVAGVLGSARLVKLSLEENLINLSAEQEQIVANEMSDTLQLEINAVKEKLQLIAQLPEVADAETKTCNEKLQTVFATMETKVGNLGRVGIDGKFACSLNKALIGMSAANFGTYITTIFEDPAHQPVMSRAVIAPGANSYLVAVHVPVYDKNGAFNGTLGGAIYFNDLTEKYFKGATLARNGYFVLFDDDGTVLFHPKNDLIGKKVADSEVVSHYTNNPTILNDIVTSGSNAETGIREYEFQGRKELGAFSSVTIFPNRRWILAVSVPVQEVNNSLLTVGVERLFTKLVIIVLSVTSASAMLFLLFMFRMLLNPLEKIKDAAVKIGKGELDTKVDIASHDELGEVAKTINIMTGRLKELYEGLETKVHERTVQLEESNKKLLELDKLKDEFVSVASHELRTPMGAIKSFISMIFDGDYGPVNKKLQEPLTDIKLSADRLIHLVNDMLDVTRIEAGRVKFTLREVYLNNELDEVVKTLMPLAKEKKLKLVFDKNKDYSVQADSDKVKQIVANLIGNALKFTNTGEIKIVTHDFEEYVEIEVSDTGIGIGSDSKHKLFGKFERIGSGQKDRPIGTGLGLYISKQLATKMGGDLLLKSSEVNKGSIFTLRLPKINTQIAKEVALQIATEAGEHSDQK